MHTTNTYHCTIGRDRSWSRGVYFTVPGSVFGCVYRHWFFNLKIRSYVFDISLNYLLVSFEITLPPALNRCSFDLWCYEDLSSDFINAAYFELLRLITDDLSLIKAFSRDPKDSEPALNLDEFISRLNSSSTEMIFKSLVWIFGSSICSSSSKLYSDLNFEFSLANVLFAGGLVL